MASELMETLKEAITGLSPTTFFTVLAAGVTVYYIVSVFFMRGSSDHRQQHSPMSSEEDVQSRSMASSSSSSSHSLKHEVFLSFRGEDTRKGFVGHLYTALAQPGIQTYKDDETLPRGESIRPALLKAIQESRIAVIVFSENYADSSWCLDELQHIMECMDTRGQIVEPIFYFVDPSDVRKQKGKYEEAFRKHKRENKHKVESWRKALEKAGNLSGWVIDENSYEAKCIKEIVDTISNRLPTLTTNFNKNLIGIENRLQDLKSKLRIRSDGVRIVGIWGVGGGGKTTLASAVYAELSHLFEAHCLLQNIREESSKHGLKKLQKKFLKLVLKTKDIEVGGELEGRSIIERKLRSKRVLVVLDDVDDVKQLEELAGAHDWFGEGSRIIITTRDEHLLSSRYADEVYEVSLLSPYEAIELFSRHAFQKDKPIEDYEMLSEEVVSYAGGLPLALEVLGSFLYDKNKDEWKCALARLKDIPDVEVTKRLKISYDGLTADEKVLFLDIACFFRGEYKDRAMKVLDACDLHPGIGIKVLVQKSLIKVSDGRFGRFEMHDLIEEMAHNIVRGEHPKNPEKHSRIWKEEDIAYLCDMGADAPPMETEVLLYNHLGLSQVVANMKKLRWIRLYDYPASSFPSNFQPKELGYLKLKWSKQKELWHGYKRLPNLKILDLSGSQNLIRTPDFKGLPCLERLILKSCWSLEEIHPSIGYHKRLVFVNLTCCSSLKRFPPIIHMKKLETLYLSGCQELQQFPDIQSNMDSLVTLDLSGTGIEIIPPSVGRFCTNLVSLDLSDCRRLKMIVGNFHLVRSLKYLNLSYCEELQSFHQDRLASLDLPQFSRSLRELDLSDCNLGDGDIPSDICELLNLQLLYALEKAAGNLSGWVINDTENSYETKCIKEIVDTISNRLHTLTTNANKNLIGIKARLRDLKSKLKIGSDGVRIVGIWGVGGGGKTTLASAAYAELSHHFEAHCLLQNIREESNKHGLEKLQEKFLSLVLKTKDVVVGSEIEGRSMIERRLCRKCILLVLDDVDDVKQLEALAGSHAWFGEGSRIIITTRDEHLLTRHADTIYEVSLLSDDEAMELFNKHAYREDEPIEDYEMLSKDVVSYASGLPLALEILGSFLYDKNKVEWKRALDKLKCIPNVKVTERLKISYDGLEPDHQKLFLDIACFWRRRELDEAMMVLDACNLHPHIGVKVLVQKSLIKVSNGEFGDKIVDMHDLVEEMAHYIVRGAHPNHPEKHSRIWKMEDIAYLCHMGADAVPMETEALAFHCPYGDSDLSDAVGLSDVVVNMKKLRWIRFDKYPASSFPSNFQPTELGCLELQCSRLKELWHGNKSLPNLKILYLRSSHNLIKTPDFEGLPCLERLILSDCESLEEIHPSIGYHKRLVFVDMRWCRRLKRFPPIIHMKKLEILKLSNCYKLQQFPDIQSNMDSLVSLDLSDTGIEIIPPSVGRLPGLKFLDLSNCWNLVELLDLPSSIAILKAEDCDSLKIVRDLSDYKWLWKVSLWGCYKLIGGERVLHSMLEGNAAKDRFMSVLLPAVEPSSRIFTRLVTLQLPSNWHSDFSGLLLFLRDDNEYGFSHGIDIKQETSTYDYSEESDEDWEQCKYEMVGYVPFTSLRHIPWLNPTYAKNILFQTNKGGLNVELVRSKNKIVDLNENPIDYSECWDEEYEHRKTFEIMYDSQSSNIRIVWNH